jgi:hypothetical protein
MSGIFISYRREDSAGWTGRLAERLKQKFGAEAIFMDIDTIQPGADFAEALRAAVGACDVLLAIIGPEWSLVKNAEGQARLQDPNDWVRTELTAALSRSIPVIPVLVGGATLPKLATLHDDLRKLFNYQAHELTDKRWEFDSSQLVKVLEKVVRGAKPKRNIVQSILTGRSTWVALVVLGLLMALASIQFLKGEDVNSLRVAYLAFGSRLVGKEAELKYATVAKTVEKPTENTADNEHSTMDQQQPASPGATAAFTSETSTSNKRISSASPAVINLLSQESGGHVIVADKDLWLRTIDGSDKGWEYVGQWAVYGFKNDGLAVFDTFKVLILETRGINLKEFELLAGNDSPTGKFESIGKFQTQNVRFFKDPWQAFKFPAVKARYLKVRVISSHGGDLDGALTAVDEFQLLGVLGK